MAYFLFTEAILEGSPIRIFNQGDMKRDFTYVDDIVAAVSAVVTGPPPKGDALSSKEIPCRIYNLGNNSPVPLMEFIEWYRSFFPHEK